MNDHVLGWIVILFLTIGLFFLVIGLRDWWNARMGPDPLAGPEERSVKPVRLSELLRRQQ